jgi:hypothetical protein
MKSGPHLTDAEIRERIMVATNDLILTGKRATIGQILGRCSGATRGRYRTALAIMVAEGALLKRRDSR